MSILHSIQMEIDQFMQSYWQTYFSGDLQKYSSLIREDYHNIGTTETEDWRSKSEMMQYSESVIDQMVGTVQVRNRKLHIMPIYPYYMVHEHIDLYIHTDKQWVFYSKMRLSSLIEKNNFGWQVIHQHGSVPDAKAAENESIGFEQVQRENSELRDAIKRSTYELEQKNKELEIEASLERVRTASMTMRQSSEIGNLIFHLYGELTGLDAKLDRCFIMIVNPENYGITWWLAGKEGLLNQNGFFIQYNHHPSHLLYLNHWGNRTKKWQYLFEGKEKEEWDHFGFSSTELSKLPDPVKEDMTGVKKIYLSGSSDSFGCLVTGSFEPLSEEHQDIISRFAVVFNQTYTRFLDLQKAEAQAREAQIQLALERVRARTMGMHHSSELADTATILFQQIKELGFEIWSCGFSIWKHEVDLEEAWMSAGDSFPIILIPFKDDPTNLSIYEAAKQGESVFEAEVKGEEMTRHYDWLMSQPSFKIVFSQIENSGIILPTVQWKYAAFFKHGYLHLITTKHQPGIHDIISRFSKVFEHTYTRFLDLQKAEAQAIEAQIEAALEKVRSRSLAMHKSEELNEVVSVLFEKLKELQIPATAVGISIYIDGSKDLNAYVCGENEAGLVITNYRLPYFHHKISEDLYKAREQKLEYFIGHYSKEEKDSFYQILFENATDLKNLSEGIRKMVFDSPSFILTTIPVNNAVFNINDFEGRGLAESEIDIIKRFARVFDQAYTRFLDLQKAEAQAREAQIEAALEKVRSRSLAMQKSDELTDVAELLRKEMGQLGIEELETSSIYIVDSENQQAACWYAIKDIREKNKRLVSDEITITFDDTWVGTEMKKFYRAKNQQASIIMKGENRKEWINYCAGKSQVLQGYYGDNIPERTYHLVKFAGGYVGAAASGDISAESWDLLRRATSVFSLAYTRFNDLQIAETNALKAERDLIAIKEAKQKAEETLIELQATQRQLIQSEKMASLGELTAGIAHEIQNPLNFVNNFSEVSNELIDEMKEELSKGDIEEAITISTDIKSNLEKIHFHGKRADAIVKGMLQHSRTSSGQKELTDINALCDEYLRLAYHGLRARDKSFNAIMETVFDPESPTISIVPQDIGRVVLNVINNAFYAVSEKSKVLSQKSGSDYLPKVTVSTKSMDDKIEISISDNGNGIPDHIKDKIFQPFFTTKPTGQGTGLGLSLSYDIVKAQGGELKVESQVGEGAEFIIQIPNI